MTAVKPWMRPRYLEWRREYEKSDKYRKRVRLYSRKRRADPQINAVIQQYQKKYRSNNRMRVMILRVIRRAKKRAIPYDETYLKSLYNLQPTHCACCGIAFHKNIQALRYQPHPATASMDRIDPTKGYVHGNVAIICFRCNILKKDGTLKEFEALVSYMTKHL